MQYSLNVRCAKRSTSTVSSVESTHEVITPATHVRTSHTCEHDIWLREFLQIWCKCSVGLKDEVIRIWWPEVRGQVWPRKKNTVLVKPQEFIDNYDKILHKGLKKLWHLLSKVTGGKCTVIEVFMINVSIIWHQSSGAATWQQSLDGNSSFSIDLQILKFWKYH